MKDFDIYKKEEEVFRHIPNYANTDNIGFINFIILSMILILILSV